MQSRRITRGVLLLGAVLACVAAVAARAGAAGNVAVIKSTGGEHYAKSPNPPNLLDVDTLHWAPGIITVHSGQTIKLVDTDNSGQPHVLAIAKKQDLPGANSNPGTNPVIRRIAPVLLNDPTNPNSGFRAYQSNAGPNGLNQEGDALVILPGGPHKTATWLVSAKPGTTLYYFCAVHFWMRGEIKVIK